MIRRFLDLSTAHLSPADRCCLDTSAADPGRGPLLCGSMSHGWFVYAFEERLDAPRISDTLWALMTAARWSGAEYLLFDGDAAVLEGFPCFDWEERPRPDDEVVVVAAAVL
ncbi:hypothetical protein LPC08_24480 (plasmid) [Roseomonas sp. OT10]|uniref:DUF5983 family protein n=1 Tax=Roseomonas cutis TaxID=2897332 RepID=UPI001E45F0CA|nr:hypothetical protein [Roseomonas sp. OT10]UFN51680.1 hypothetical protein LPC08_24480 [Roseomonas sp. OT10]